MRITTLIENSRAADEDGLTVEHGLSLLVEHEGRCILFDTGETGRFADNAKALGIDLASVDCVVISHHHFDHGGGLRRFLDLNARAPVYLRPHPDGECTGKFLWLKKYIGLDEELLRTHADRFVYVEDDMEIVPGAFILTHIGRAHALPLSNGSLYLQRGETLVHDNFAHELVLVVREADGLCVLTGCGHRGVLNMLDAVRRAWPDVPVKAVVGGFHMMAMPPLNLMSGRAADVRAVGLQLLQRCNGRILTGHCTGTHAYEVLKEVMGDRLDALATGLSVTL